MNRQLKRFKEESLSSGSTKRPGALSTTYEVVPKNFQFSNIVELKADLTDKLPVFTSEHYQLQFLKPALPKSLPKNMFRSKTKRSPATGRTRQATTPPPPRSVNADSVDDVASTLSRMGLSIRGQRNVKYAVVGPNDTKYQDVIDVIGGINNPWDIDDSQNHHLREGCGQAQGWTACQAPPHSSPELRLERRDGGQG